MFQKVMIANRGAIACRIIRTLKKMGIASVAVYAEADADSLHVQQADESHSLGDGPAAATYLDQHKLLEIAKNSGAQAIHPGYGFLSENPKFAENCKAHGMAFIGPAADNMLAFALKHEARALASRFNVPLIPGTGLLHDKDAAMIAAYEMGFPVMLKSTAGGGGIGMQICRTPEQLEKSFDSVVRLSQNNFANSGVFLEKFIERARHIEVQAFGNGLGDVVTLGERECSLQRRNQKVIEETPAPNLEPGVRERMHQTAEQLLAGVNYQSAGTVEFIYDSESHKFYFLEVNTRLQVEHGVTEEVFGVDIVDWMIRQAAAPLTNLRELRAYLKPNGHAVQARIYAENPSRNFQPSAGLLSHVEWAAPEHCEPGSRWRIDSWIESGIDVSPYFDPMLAKVIAWAGSRDSAISSLRSCLKKSEIYGVETNLTYVRKLLKDPLFRRGEVFTAYLNTWEFRPSSFDVTAPGTLTTVQDLHGRRGYWEVGVPPSGPFDPLSFRRGNQLLDNHENCAGLEITLNGPTLQFNSDTQVVVAGADIEIELNATPQPMWTILDVAAGQTLKLGKLATAGARAYLLIRGGIQCPDYLGSKSTFTLGRFGGHAGRALRTGDSLNFKLHPMPLPRVALDNRLRPRIAREWTIDVIYGPHGAPDFFTEDDITTFFSSEWEVHYNSSRTGIRLIGPKPQWARESGGEAGMHPSNIHDNAYAFGTVDFTGDMPVILGPDGPSLGGFVCPATVIHADLWKLGQLRAGDKISFRPVTIETALEKDRAQLADDELSASETSAMQSCILRELALSDGTAVAMRAAGDRFLLLEMGEQKLDIALRLRIAALHKFLREKINGDVTLAAAITDITPGIRSLQVHYNPHLLPLRSLTQLLESECHRIEKLDDVRVPSRIVHLPLSWDDAACRLAVQKYMQSVRADAPWCPDNIEFIRRINGLESAGQVREILFNADYVVMGLGDVYLGAPVATPLNPAHRLVTTKYNPARTWTAENSVGIGGAYLCVYGMEGPGGYQFVGRTLQMWNRYKSTREFAQPWLLRFFDRIRFFPVASDELEKIRRDFPRGNYPLTIEDGEFSLADYQQLLLQKGEEINAFQTRREKAFAEELQRWRESGQFHFEASKNESNQDVAEALPPGWIAVESNVAGNVWQVNVKEGERVQAGQTLLVLESMKMEIEVTSPADAVVRKLLKGAGNPVSAGQALIHIEELL